MTLPNCRAVLAHICCVSHIWFPNYLVVLNCVVPGGLARQKRFSPISLCKPNSFSATLPRSYKRVQRWNLVDRIKTRFKRRMSISPYTFLSREKEKNIKRTQRSAILELSRCVTRAQLFIGPAA